MSDLAKEKIKDKLLELSATMDVEKITVTMLVRECRISRTLFYYYYQDIRAVVEDILSTKIEKIATECLQEQDGKTAIHLFVQDYMKLIPLLRKVYRSSYYRAAQEDITTILTGNVKKVLFQRAGNRAVSIGNVDFQCEFIAGAITAWFFRHCEDPTLDAEEIAEHLDSIMLSY